MFFHQGMRFLLALLLFGPGGALQAHPLLEQAAEKWMAGRNRWSFTQEVRETDKDGRTSERVENYSPARGPERRWKLVSVDGRTPSSEEVEKWERRKNRRQPRPARPLEHYVDLARAEVAHEDEQRIDFRLPLRRPAGWLASGQQVVLLISVDKEARSVTRVQAGLDGPLNVALGLAQVVHFDLDLETSPEAAGEGSGPEGAVYATVNRLGRRIDYAWRDFVQLDAR